MDLIRASIKALFYDYTPDMVSGYVVDSAKDAGILRHFAEMASWREQHFTLSEMNELLNVLKNRWLNQPEFSNAPMVSKLLLLPSVFTNQIMHSDNVDSYPVIIFDNLLRWRELSYYISEDLLTCCHLANEDEGERKRFVWNTHLSHDNPDVNQIVGEGLTDIHHHLWGSIDVAELNWIRLMNKPETWNINNGISIDDSATSKDLILVSNEERYSLYHWIVVASAIRVILFKWLQSPLTEVCIEDINQLITADDGKIVRWANNRHKKEMESVRKNVLKTRKEHLAWDYAIADDIQISEEDKKSPYMLHYGERKLMYFMFKVFFQSKNDDDGTFVRNLAKYFYLYLIIKVHIRKQLVQTNPLKGLGNFMKYMVDQKRCFPSDISDKRYDSVLYRYVVQKAVGSDGQYGLENRFNTVEGKDLLNEDCTTPIFCQGKCIESIDKITTVASLSKELFSGKRDKDMIMVHLNEIVNQYSGHSKSQTDIVGVDFAGMELNVRPEKVAPFIRWLRLKGISHFTYHIGEDYLDLIDGLRSIDELLKFAEFQEGDRLGHALALGVNPGEYYESRHYNVIAPKLNILDNIVWLAKTVEAKDDNDRLIIKDLEKIAAKLFRDCGYKGIFHMDAYWNSMLLRGDSLSEIVGLSDWANACLCKAAEDARKDENAVSWRDFYRKIDRSSISFQWPKGIVSLVEKCQLQLRNSLSTYHIEVCPSSNVHIGGFHRYDCHPMLNIQKVNGEPLFSLSMNTDDSGIFSTSLPLEYSLMAIALYKQGYTKDKVIGLLNQWKSEAAKNRFNKIIKTI